MQKKLLLLLIVISCSVVYAEDEKTVPVISDEEHASNIERYNELENILSSRAAETEALEKEKDEIEAKRCSYDLRNQHREKLVDELSGKQGAINACQTHFNSEFDKFNMQRKRQNNGIERAWFSGVTDPIAGSDVAKVYKRIDAITAEDKRNNKALYDEHTQYAELVVKNILPNLQQDVIGKKAAINEVHVKALQRCNCFDGDDRYVCLARWGVSRDAVTEYFPAEFVKEAFATAYANARKNNIPINTLEELIGIAEKNAITKDDVAKLYVAKAEWEKLVKRESSNSGTSSTSEPKPHIDLSSNSKQEPEIFEDPKEDQGDQGALSQ